MERFTGERRNAIKRDLFAPGGLSNQELGIQGVGLVRLRRFAAIARNRGIAVTLFVPGLGMPLLASRRGPNSQERAGEIQRFQN